VSDLALISAAAKDAVGIALRLQTPDLVVEKKPDGSPITGADRAVDDFLRQRLTAARPDYGWLSEETPDGPERLLKDKVFIVDPIDGTRSYMRGKPYWAVCIAVASQGEPVAGVVYAGALDERYAAEKGGGATLNDQPIQPSAVAQLEDSRMLGDDKLFSHPGWARPWPPMLVETRNAIAYRIALVASGAFDAAVALSAKSEWDVAAAALIAEEAGAKVTDHKGRRFVFNTPKAKAPSLVCAAPGLHPLILERTSPIDLPS
jgi:myo-inositol-1(or 4)-monophosphatase